MEARNPNQVFVRVPNEPGRWILAERCVVEIPCPKCHAAIGEPCFNERSGKYWVNTHWRRRSAFQCAKKDSLPRVRVSATIGGE